MRLFAAKKPCFFCGNRVKQPQAGGSTVCPRCDAPGPWASEAAIEAHRLALAEQKRQEEEAQGRRQYEEELSNYERLRAALELKSIAAPGFIAQKAEEVYEVMPAQLLDWKKERGHYEGGSGIRGVSVRVPGTKSMRAYYGGLSQRRFVPGAEGWTPVDSGTAVITSKRVVFRGVQRNVEWAFAKLVGADIDELSSALVLQVTNRQKSPVLQLEDLSVFELRFEAAIARFQQRPAPTLYPPSPPASLKGSDAPVFQGSLTTADNGLEGSIQGRPSM